MRGSSSTANAVTPRRASAATPSAFAAGERKPTVTAPGAAGRLVGCQRRDVEHHVGARQHVARHDGGARDGVVGVGRRRRRPAPLSTTTSRPVRIRRVTLSGVAATRFSPVRVSAGPRPSSVGPYPRRGADHPHFARGAGLDPGGFPLQKPRGVRNGFVRLWCTKPFRSAVLVRRCPMSPLSPLADGPVGLRGRRARPARLHHAGGALADLRGRLRADDHGRHRGPRQGQQGDDLPPLGSKAALVVDAVGCRVQTRSRSPTPATCAPT